MADPISAAGDISGKLLTMAAGFLGSLITLGLNEQPLPMRQWAALILFGALAAFFAPPLIVAQMQHAGITAWMPLDGSLEGLLGLTIGMGCIYITRALNVIGRRFSADPIGFFLRRGAKEEKK